GEPAERTAQVVVRGQPAVETGVSDSAVVPGESITLSWSVRDAVRVIVREVEGPILVDTDGEFEGSIEVEPKRSTTYEIRGVGVYRDTVKTVRVEVALRILTFELDAAGPIGEGKLATLRWKTAGAVELWVTNLEGAEERVGGYRVDEGSTRLPMGKDGRFLLRAVGGSGEEVEATVTGEVLGLPSLAEFFVTPEVQSQQLRPAKVTVFWSGIENAERVTLVTDTLGRVGIFEPPFEDGSLDFFLTETTEFRFTVSNAAGDVVRTAVAEVVPLPKIHEFAVFPSHAESGEPVTISWAVDDAVSVVIEENGNPLPVEPSTTTGTYSFTASQPATYRLVATNRAGGTAEVVRALTIGPPQIPVFTASRSILTAGDVLELNWETRGGNQLDILENGSVIHTETTAEGIASGSLLVPPRPMDDYVYTLRLQNGLGTTVERQVQVVRTNGPVIESFTLEEDVVCTDEAPVVSWSVTADSFGAMPSVRMEGPDFSVPLSGATGSAPLPPLPPGIHTLTLVAEHRGARPLSVSRCNEAVSGVYFLRVELTPPEPEAGSEVTVSWRAICADEVRLKVGSFVAEPSTHAFLNIAATGILILFTGL